MRTHRTQPSQHIGHRCWVCHDSFFFGEDGVNHVGFRAVCFDGVNHWIWGVSHRKIWFCCPLPEGSETTLRSKMSQGKAWSGMTSEVEDVGSVNPIAGMVGCSFHSKLILKGFDSSPCSPCSHFMRDLPWVTRVLLRLGHQCDTPGITQTYA